MTMLIQDLYTDKQDKIQKPNFQTRTGREFLAFYLSTKLKQAVAWDKKHQNNFFLEVKQNFLANFLKKIIDHPQNSITIGFFGEAAVNFTKILETNCKALELPVLFSGDFCALLEDEKVIILTCKNETTQEHLEHLDIKIYAKGKKERLLEEDDKYEIIVNGNAEEDYIAQILKYIKLITNDFC